MSHSSKPQGSKYTKMEPVPPHESNDFMDEELLSAEEQQEAQKLAEIVDGIFANRRSFPEDEASGVFSNESEALASWAMLLRHSASPPSLRPERKADIEQELYAYLDHGSTTSMEISNAPPMVAPLSWWQAIQQHVRAVMFRPAWVLTGLLLCVGSWGLFQTFSSPSHTNPSGMWSSQPTLTWFQGIKDNPTKNNPFLQTRSATERLKQTTTELQQWQREHWVTRLREHRYRG